MFTLKASGNTAILTTSYAVTNYTYTVYMYLSLIIVCVQMRTPPLMPALMVLFDWKVVVTHWRAEWKSASTEPGAQCVIMDSAVRMQQWSATSWDYHTMAS